MGRRPFIYAGYTGYQRSDLIARLLRERLVARFIVAPTGYGKTSLLIDYAETVFSWTHVFWINGKSPCFLRDLDEGDIAGTCKACDQHVRLVIFDDVPALDPTRAQLFSQQIDKLLSMKCEVVVACTPRSDSLSRLQRDRVRIAAHDMLVNEDELAKMSSAEARRLAQRLEALPATARVPALVWQSPNATPEQFLKGVIKEQMPADMLLAMATMLVLHRGHLDALDAVAPFDPGLLDELASGYPHLGIDVDAGRFNAPQFSIDEIAAAYRGLLEAMVGASRFETRDKLVWAWADSLLSMRDCAGRACETIRRLCPRSKRISWLRQNVLAVASGGCFFESCKLAHTVRTTNREATARERALCLAIEAVSCMVLEDSAEAARHAKTQAFDEGNSQEIRICCLLVLLRIGPDTLRKRAQSELASISAKALKKPVKDLTIWEVLALLGSALGTSAISLGEIWCMLDREGADKDALAIGASWLFSEVERLFVAGLESDALSLSASIVDAERFARDELNRLVDGPNSYFASTATLAMERAHVAGMPYARGALSATTLLALRHAEMQLLSQKTRFVRWSKSDDDDNSGADAARAVSAGADFSKIKIVRNVPVLSIKMFGRFEVMLGDDVIDERLFRRRHMRLLLLLLTINLGRDVSRDSLARQLWPNVSADQAVRSFYSTWSKLRRALSLEDGSCPYLVRHQYGCSLDERCVHSDIARLNEICRELLFGRPDVSSWTELYYEIDRDFSNELLPSEETNEVVVHARADARSRLVDALVSATHSIIDAQNPQMAIWFARAAIGHDDTREDAYVALMRAQIAASQRTAAMMTYHTCRRVLSDRLGVDPSPETVALYESLLDGE